MKKILLYAAMVLLSVTSCLKFEEPTSLEVQSAGAPTIEVSGLTENTFTATITPAAGTNFYAYAVLAGEANPKVSASNLLKVKVGSDIAEGLVDVKNEATKTIALKGLVGNTKYTVYAAATNEQGQVASVTTLEVLTDDKTNPTIKAIAVSKVGQVQFTEPVKLVSGKKAWVTYYKYFDQEDSVTMEIPAKNMAVNGSVLQLTPPKHIPGAYTIYTYEEGLVTDYVGQECPAQMTARFDILIDIFESDSLVMKGVAGRIPTEKWDLVWEDDNKAGDTTIYFTSPYDLSFTFKTPEIAVLDAQGYSNVKNGVGFAYSSMFGSNASQYVLSKSYYDINPLDSTITFGLGQNLAMYTDVDLSVAAGTFTDMYGNTNNAFSREAIAEYIYCVSTGIEGQYVQYLGGNAGSDYDPFEVKVVNDTTAYVYGLYEGIPNTHPLKAVYDKKAQTLKIPFGQPYFVAGQYNVGFYGWNITRLYPDYEGDILLEGSVTLELQDNGFLASEDMFILAQLPASSEEEPEYRFEDEDVTVFGLGLLYNNYGIVKVSNELNVLASSSVPSNYVETPKAIGTLADMPALLKAKQAK